MQADVVKIRFDRKTGKEISRKVVETKELPEDFFTLYYERQFPELYDELQKEQAAVCE